MGEGWGDWYGTVMTIGSGQTGSNPSRGVGTYLFGEAAGGAGIRPFPYSTDLAVNPQTYDNIKTATVPHGVGSVWATTLWEVTWGLIDEHGFDTDIYNFTGDVSLDAGNVMALALVTEGMKLQPCSPGFVDGRDAIIAADQAIYGGANYCILWETFAKRGLGFSANQGSTSSVTDGTEAFDLPTTLLDTAEEVCVSQGIQTFGGGTPVGGVYSGSGVTDDGNGTTYTFDPSVVGAGVHTISYEVTSQCTPVDVVTDTLEVTSDIPEIICQDVIVELDDNGEATIVNADVVSNLLPGELVVDQTGTFSPITISGTSVNLGDDQVSSALNIGFSFNFYDIDYTNFHISSNGFITFTNDGDSGCCTGDLLPFSGLPNNLIAIAWEDLNPSAGGTISYETIGSAPNRKLIIEFDEIPFFNSSSTVTSQIHLFEDSNRIEIHSTSIGADGNTTQGVENENGTDGLATPGRNSQIWSATNDYVAFYRIAGETADNCGSPTTVTLSQNLFTCDDIGGNDVTVTIEDGNGNTNTCIAVVTVTEDVDPELTCPIDLTVVADSNNNFLIPDYTSGATATDNCTTSPTITQDPVAGTSVGLGITTITLTAVDESGNDVTCTFELTVDELVGIEDANLSNNIKLYPNPTTNFVKLINNSSEKLVLATIVDMNGQIIQVIDLSSNNIETSIPFQKFTAGLYFIKIESENASIIKKIVKR